MSDFEITKRDHSPFFCLLRIIDLGPRIPRAKPIGLTIMVRHGMIIFYSVAEEQITSLLGGFPPRCHATTRRLATEVREHFPCLVQDILLLLESLFFVSWMERDRDPAGSKTYHVTGVLMTVTVKTDLMSGISHHSTFLMIELSALYYSIMICTEAGIPLTSGKVSRE